MSWITDNKPASFSELFQLRSNLYTDYQRFAELFWSKQLVPAAILELCRLRVAQLHRCAPELASRHPQAQAAGLDESKIAALADWHQDARFSNAERACLAISECFAIDPHSITDEMASAVVDELGDAGLVALLECLALFDGFCRFQVLLQAQPEGGA